MSAPGSSDRGYVLHTYPYRETSLIIEAWTEHHGRMALMARGARRPKSVLRGVLGPFQPLSLSWFGKGEMKTLKTAEAERVCLPLGGASMMSAFYLNELLLKLTQKEDPHEGLFAAYDEAVSKLRAASGTTNLELALRRFEKHLLKELGYALLLSNEADSGAPVAAEREYSYVVERGPIPAGAGTVQGDAVKLDGATLLDLENERFGDARSAAQAKQLMRHLINHFLNGQVLHTRQLVKELQQI